MTRSKFCHRGGFTLTELLVAVAIIAIFISITLKASGVVMDRAYQAHCASNLRTLSIAAVNFANDRNGYFWSREETGYSRYRKLSDPMGVPQLLKDYVGNPSVWLCKGGRPSLRVNGVNYVWAISDALDKKPLSAFDSPNRIVLFWDNYNYMEPSIENVRDGGTSGPPAASAPYHRFPHVNKKKAYQVYASGHVVFEGDNIFAK